MKVIRQESGNNWHAWQGDSIEMIQSLPSNSVHYNIESPPFLSLFCYSDSVRDMGNCKSDAEFYEQFCFLVREKFRVMKPGRLVSQHCMNVPTAKWLHGYIGIRDFRGELIRIFLGDDAADFSAAIRKLRLRMFDATESGDNKRAIKLQDTIQSMEEELKAHPGDQGFIYHSEVCIWKDPVIAQQRTNAIGLLHKQLVKDSTISRQGLADYLVTFRKPGDNPEPVAGALYEYHGEDFTADAIQSEVLRQHQEQLLAWNEWQRMTDEERQDVVANGLSDLYPSEKPELERPKQGLSIDIWQKYASPVWMDINPNDTLNGEAGKRKARDEKDTRHICPLQMQVIKRGIQLWSNPGDVVMTNFGGIGSEAVAALEMGRKAIAMELKGSYFDQLVKNCRKAAGDETVQTSLFDLVAV